jgi:hypothetical protein
VYNENYEKEKTLQLVDSVPPSFLNLSVDLSVESPYGITKVKNSHGFRHAPASVVDPDPDPYPDSDWILIQWGKRRAKRTPLK